MFVEWVSVRPARLVGLQRSKGAIAVGLDADFVVFDPEATFEPHAARPVSLLCRGRGSRRGCEPRPRLLACGCDCLPAAATVDCRHAVATGDCRSLRGCRVYVQSTAACPPPPRQYVSHSCVCFRRLISPSEGNLSPFVHSEMRRLLYLKVVSTYLRGRRIFHCGAFEAAESEPPPGQVLLRSKK